MLKNVQHTPDGQPHGGHHNSFERAEMPHPGHADESVDVAPGLVTAYGQRSPPAGPSVDGAGGGDTLRYPRARKWSDHYFIHFSPAAQFFTFENYRAVHPFFRPCS